MGARRVFRWPTTMSRLPRFDSIDELARFWDTHDLTHYEDELEEVEKPAFKAKAGTVVKIRLLPKQAAALRRRAKSAGVAFSSLGTCTKIHGGAALVAGPFLRSVSRGGQLGWTAHKS